MSLQAADIYFEGMNTKTFDSQSTPKYCLTSLNQLSALYGSKSPHEIARSVVYGVKPKPQYQGKREQSVRSYTSEDAGPLVSSKCRSPPSKLTILSQQLFHHVPSHIETVKSSRAFFRKDENLLLSPERLRSMPSPQSRPMNDVTNRLQDFQDVLDTKKERLKERFVQEKMAECTFQPQIDNHSRNMVLKSAQQEIRSVEQFRDDQMKYLQSYQHKKEQAQEQKVQDELHELQEAPKLTTKTEKLAHNRFGNSGVVERLYCVSPSKRTQVSVSQEKALDPVCSFHPEISNKSKQLKREQVVQDFLYSDAQKRREKQQQSIQQSISATHMTSTMVSEASIGWFVQRFIKEFYYQLSCLNRIKSSEQKDYSRLTYSETLEVLQGLNYLRQVQYCELEEDQRLQLALLWQHLSPQEPPASSVLSRNLLVVLLSILAVPISHTAIPLYKPHQLHDDEGACIGDTDVLFQQSRADLLQPDEDGVKNVHKPRKPSKQLSHDQNGNLTVSASDAQYLHQTFYSLFLNTKQLATGNGKRRQLARSPLQSERLHSPMISKNSQSLSQSKRILALGDREFNINEWFDLQSELKEQRREQLKKQVVEAELKDCTFGIKAQHCTINLQELARPIPKSEDRRPQDIEFERQQESCTFQPKISNLKTTSLMLTSNYDSLRQQISKTADRLKEGRVRKQALQQIKEKGLTTNNKSRGIAKRNVQEQENNYRPQKVKGIRSIPMKKTRTEGSDELASSRKRKDDYDLVGDHEQQRFSKDRADDEKVPKFMQDQVPLLFVDVNIEEGKTARIVVFDGDRSDELAERFSQEYNLDESMKLKLKELLDLQINSLLTKIDEDFQEESDKDTLE